MIWPERPPADWLGVDEARARVLAMVSPLPSEQASLALALNRALAAPIVAGATLPPWDNSAMDGYAVRGADLVGALPDRPVQLRVVGETRAGERWDGVVGHMEAVRIMTGGPIPRQADSVVRVEDTDREARAGVVLVRSERDRGRNLRPSGQDMRPGDRLLEAGEVLAPGGIAAAAAAGLTEVSVHRRPRVCVLTSGDELRAPDRFDDVREGRGIPDTNAPLLLAAAAELGALATSLGPVRDEISAVRECLETALAGDADLLVTVGGASMGRTDLFREVLSDMGLEPSFWRIRMRPGSPFSAGLLPRADGSALPLLGLPGNPVSAYVTFHLFVREALLRLAGHRHTGLPVMHALAGATLSGGGTLTHFLRVRVESREGAFVVTPTGPQGSGLVSGLAHTDGLAVVPEGIDEIPEGGAVTVRLLRPVRA